MPRRHLIVNILIITLISIIVSAGWQVAILSNRPAPVAAPSPIEEFDPACPLKIKGLKYISHEKERRVMEMSIDELKINPRKFMIFNIAKFNELTITNANLKLYFTTDSENHPPFEPIEKMAAPLKCKKNSHMKLGLVTRGVVKKLNLQIYHDKLLHLTVEAGAAEIDFKEKKVQMKKARVGHIPSGRAILSSKIVWDMEKKCFKVPGKFIAETPTGSVQGSKIEFDLDFVVKKSEQVIKSALSSCF